MKATLYYFIHITALLLLAGSTFYAFAAPESKNKKKILSIHGILSLLVLISGFGLLSIMNLGFPGWILVKVVCWLGLAALVGIAFRKKEKIPCLIFLAGVLIITAVAMVYFRPF